LRFKVRPQFKTHNKRRPLAWNVTEWELKGNRLIITGAAIYYRSPSGTYARKYPLTLILIHELLENLYIQNRVTVKHTEDGEELLVEAHNWAKRWERKIHSLFLAKSA